MDNLTHILLGATIGQAVGRRRLGWIALAAGAVANTIPDLDVLPLAFAGDGLAEWRDHRALTHSLWFGAVVGPLLGWASWRFFRRRPGDGRGADAALRSWIAVWTVSMISHALLDASTIYGTQLLQPFSDRRFAIPAVGIIDPFYTVILLAAVLLALVVRRRAEVVAWLALLGSTAYLVYGWGENQAVAREARRQLAAQGIVGVDVAAYTTIFQPWLRRVVVTEPWGIRVGYISSAAPRPADWFCHLRADDPAIDLLRGSEAGQVLDWFSGGNAWPVVAREADGTVRVTLLDTRYGAPGPTVLGWWGVSARYAADGRAIEAPRRIAVPRTVSRDVIAGLWAATSGDAAPLYRASGIDLPAAPPPGAPPGCRMMVEINGRPTGS